MAPGNNSQNRLQTSSCLAVLGSGVWEARGREARLSNERAGRGAACPRSLQIMAAQILEDIWEDVAQARADLIQLRRDLDASMQDLRVAVVRQGTDNARWLQADNRHRDMTVWFVQCDARMDELEHLIQGVDSRAEGLEAWRQSVEHRLAALERPGPEPTGGGDRAQGREAEDQARAVRAPGVGDAAAEASTATDGDADADAQSGGGSEAPSVVSGVLSEAPPPVASKAVPAVAVAVPKPLPVMGHLGPLAKKCPPPPPPQQTEGSKPAPPQPPSSASGPQTPVHKQLPTPQTPEALQANPTSPARPWAPGEAKAPWTPHPPGTWLPPEPKADPPPASASPIGWAGQATAPSHPADGVFAKYSEGPRGPPAQLVPGPNPSPWAQPSGWDSQGNWG